MKQIVGVIAAVALAGCAAPKPLSPADQAEFNRPLTCVSKDECDRYWQRAQVFVSEHAGYKMQSVTDSIIQTYGPLGQKTEVAWTVTRLPNSAGGAVIRATAQCANMIGCFPEPVPELIAFKRFVRE